MRIGKIAKIMGISPSALRFYEKNGLIRIGRDKSGIRDYDSGDMQWIKFIKRLKDTGMSIKNIKTYADLRYLGEETVSQRLEILLEHRKLVSANIAELQINLQNLDDKIKLYKENLLKKCNLRFNTK